MRTTMPDQRWSISRLELLSLCGEAFRRRYLEGEDTPSTPALARGRAVHRVAQLTHERQMLAIQQAKETPASRKIANYLAVMGWDEARDIAAGEYARSVATAIIIEGQGAELDNAVTMAEGYCRRWACEVEPEQVEQKIEVRPQGTDVTLVGVVDLVDGAGGRAIVDLKTAKRPRQGEAASSLQLTAYHSLLWAQGGSPIRTVRLDYIWRGRGGVMVTRDLAKRCEADVGMFAERVNAAVRQVEAGTYLPAASGCWLCRPKWCGYWATCRFVRGGK
jgi:hypothetical protein